jgi:Leucine-rich repeat (LRR) protein
LNCQEVLFQSLKKLLKKITKFNYSLTELMFLRLVTLDISMNRISAIPVELRFMVSLVDLCVDHNPLTSPPTHVCIDYYLSGILKLVVY